MIIIEQMLQRKAEIEKELEAIDFMIDSLERAGKIADLPVIEEEAPVNKRKRPRSEEQKRKQSETMKANWAKRHKLDREEDQKTVDESNSAWLGRIESKG